MALLETNDTIKEYYQEVKDNYPTIPFEEFMEICKAPFKFFKLKIEGEDMPTIYIKYFGKFKVFSTRLRTLLKALETKKHFNQINDERYTRHKEFLLNKYQQVKDNETERSNKSNSDRKETID